MDIDKLYLMFKEHNYNADTGTFSLIEGDINTDAKDLGSNRDEGTQIRNNMLIDIIRSVLTNPAVAGKVMTPGNFDTHSKIGRVLDLIALNSDKSFNELMSMSLEQLDNLYESQDIDILLPSTQILLHKRNMVAGKVIGMSANALTNYAKRQGLGVGINVNPVGSPRFWLNNQFRTDLSTTNNDAQYFTKTNNGYILTNPTRVDLRSLSDVFSSTVSASVDAVKDPVLDRFNINTFTFDSYQLLIGVGYELADVGLLLRQPVIAELVNYYELNSTSGMSKVQAVKDMLNKYEGLLKDAGYEVSSTEVELNQSGFTRQELINSLKQQDRNLD